MGKLKTKIKRTECKVQDDNATWWGSNVKYNSELDYKEVEITSNKIEEANKVVVTLDLPKFDKDGNNIL